MKQNLQDFMLRVMRVMGEINESEMVMTTKLSQGTQKLETQ